MGKKKDHVTVEYLMAVYEIFIHHLNDKRYEFVKGLMEAYTSSNSLNELKTVLVITKAFKEHPILGEPRAKVYAQFKKYMDEAGLTIY